MGVGIVGLGASAGWASRSHVPALRLVPGASLVACSGSSPESARLAASAHGVATSHDDAASLAADPDVEVVVVSVKVPHHRAAVVAAIAAGKHVLCEWPLARTSAEGAEMLEAARDAGVLTFVGLQSRFSPGVERARRLVRDGAIGEVLDVQVTGHGLVGAPVRDQRSRYQLDPSNGAHLGTIALAHLVDALDHVVGPWRVASGTQATAHPKVRLDRSEELVTSGSPDHLAVTGLAGRAVVSIHLRPGTPEHGLPGLRWEIRGSRGALTIHGTLALPEMTRTSVVLQVGEEIEAISWDDLVRGSVSEDPAVLPLVAGWSRIVAAVRSGRSDLPGFEDAVDLHRRLEAVHWTDHDV